VGLLTVLVTCRSACCGVSMALAVLLPVIGSNWSAAVAVAVFVWAAGLVTRAWICKVWGAVGVTVPTVQIPGALAYVPWLGVAVTNTRPAGKRSVNATSVVGSGPALVSVTVKAIMSPSLRVGLLTVLVTCKSACCGVSVTLAVLLPVCGSN